MSTGPPPTPVEEMAFPAHDDKLASPPPLPVPPPHVHQITICGCGTRVHPYWVGFKHTPHRVSEGVGCHRQDRGRRMVPSRVPDRDPSVTVNSNAGALSGVNRSGPGAHEVHVPDAPWDKRVADIGYHPSMKA